MRKLGRNVWYLENTYSLKKSDFLSRETDVKQIENDEVIRPVSHVKNLNIFGSEYSINSTKSEIETWGIGIKEEEEINWRNRLKLF